MQSMCSCNFNWARMVAIRNYWR